jgi:hypothetical protein
MILPQKTTKYLTLHSKNKAHVNLPIVSLKKQEKGLPFYPLSKQIFPLGLTAFFESTKVLNK